MAVAHAGAPRRAAPIVSVGSTAGRFARLGGRRAPAQWLLIADLALAGVFLVWYGLYALAYGAAVVVSVRARPTARNLRSRATSPPHAGAQFRNRVHVTALAVWLALAIAVSALEAAPERSSLVLRACLRVARVAFALPKLKHALVLLRSRANQQALRAQHTQTSRAQSVIELLRYVRRYLGTRCLR